jgi:hypothetical protein
VGPAIALVSVAVPVVGARLVRRVTAVAPMDAR